MGFLDAVVGPSFRDDKAGRVVVFTGDRRNRGYLVRSQTEELKIKEFLKMFCFAQFAILWLGMLLSTAWSTDITNALGRPAAHILRTSCIFLGVYSLVVVFPILLLWRSFKKARFNFVSPQDEVLVSSKRPKSQLTPMAVGLFAVSILILLGIMLLVLAR